MVDEFVGFEDEKVSLTRFTVKTDNFFNVNNRFTASGLIEHMAQSAAARVGYFYKLNETDPPIGYIAAIKDFELLADIYVGQCLYTRVRVLQEILGISLVDISCSVSEKVVATCKMKIFLNDEESKS